MRTPGKLAAILSDDTIAELALRIARVYKGFRRKTFVRETTQELDELSLFQRADRIADNLRLRLPADVGAALRILIETLDPPRIEPGYGSYETLKVLPLTRFVSRHALDHFDVAMDALYEMTRRFTAEFDIRPFILRYPEATFSRLQEWSVDADLHVRRLVAEGTRPRLPWVSRLPANIFGPSGSLDLLTRLRDDPVLYVRRSVANHLADLIKEAPRSVYDVLNRWRRSAATNCEWIICHAVRYPASKGDPDALRLLGCVQMPAVRVRLASFGPDRVRIGDTITLSVTIESENPSPQRLRVHYRLSPSSNLDKGTHRSYKLGGGVLGGGESWTLHASHAIRSLATRSFSPGPYAVTVLVNGSAKCSQPFEIAY